MMTVGRSQSLTNRVQPEALARWTGFVTKDGRRGGFSAGVRPICVDTHFVKTDEHVITEGIARCKHRSGDRQLACGVRLYIARLQFGGSTVLGSGGELLWITVEVTDEHVERMKRAPMLFTEKMQLIGCVLPGVDIKLSSVSTER